MKFIIGIIGSILIIAIAATVPGSFYSPVSNEKIQSENLESQNLKNSVLSLNDNKIETWKEEYPDYEVRLN